MVARVYPAGGVPVGPKTNDWIRVWCCDQKPRVRVVVPSSCFVLVKVQVTVSPAATTKVARRVARLPLLFVSSQLSAVSSQPSIDASVAW